MARTKDLVAEIKRCKVDPVYFIENYVKIQHATRGTLPFKMFDFQRNSIEDFKNHRFNIVLKSRQLGYTTVTAAFCLWAAMFNTDKAIIVVSTDLATAKTFFRKVAFAWEKLPKFFKVFINVETKTKQEIGFSNGSFVKAIPTGDAAGRSEALSMLVVDEAAFIPGFEELYSQVYPTLSTGGRCVILSTPGPKGNKYHQLWEDAEAKRNEFNAIKLPWHVHPDRDEKWYHQTLRNMGAAKFEVEFNCSFEGAEDNFFKPELIDKVSSAVEMPLATDDETWIWKAPQEGHKYVIGADVARGDGGDYSTLHVVDVETGEVVVEDRRHENPREFALRSIRYAKEYNSALIAPESNTFGYMMISAIRDEGYQNVYFQRVENWRKAQTGNFLPERAGFSTQRESRNAALIRLEEFLDDGFLKIKSQRFLDEMQTFILKPTKSGAMKPAAIKGKHDDLIMSLAIASVVIYQVKNGSHAEYLDFDEVYEVNKSFLNAVERAKNQPKSELMREIAGQHGGIISPYGNNQKGRPPGLVRGAGRYPKEAMSRDISHFLKQVMK